MSQTNEKKARYCKFKLRKSKKLLKKKQKCKFG